MIREASSHIVTDPKRSLPVYPDCFGKFLPLIKGKEAFEECANYLETVLPMDVLTQDERIKLKIPENKDDLLNFEYINGALKEKQQEFDALFNCYSFHFDIGGKDAATSVLMQIVDDSNFTLKRRENMLNKEFKYVGVSLVKHKGKVYVYIVFAG